MISVPREKNRDSHCSKNRAAQITMQEHISLNLFKVFSYHEAEVITGVLAVMMVYAAQLTGAN